MENKLANTTSWQAASDFEFRHRMSLMAVVYALAFGLSWLDGQKAGNTLAWLLGALGVATAGAGSQHVAFFFAAALVAAGAALRTWGTAYLDVDTMMDARLHTQRLVIAGPYRHVRHPLYLGNLLVVTGLGLLASRAGFVVLTGGMFVVVYRLILREEQHLLRQHGFAFLDFMAVPRLWPAWRTRFAPSSLRPRWRDAFYGEVSLWGAALAMAIYAATFSIVAFAAVLAAGILLSGARFRAARRAAGAKSAAPAKPAAAGHR